MRNIFYLLLVSMLCQQAIARPDYTKEVNRVNITDFNIECEEVAVIAQEKQKIQEQQLQTRSNDPYTRRANATVIIDNNPIEH
ncbi:hypothetical protein ACWA5Z_07840 [Testudinibacter sp. P80/BLE/0925]|uniref:hypothetical protein n=1 Tax=Testudinibacter sp. TW-1 TaxID=3417757 RepID=UPI003D36DC24